MATDLATVPVKSAWLSKINWTQAVAVVAALLTMFGFTLTPEQQAAIAVTITVIQALITWILKTWFTPTVSAASLPATKP